MSGIDYMKLTDQLVRSFQVVKVFDENVNKINAIDFKEDGKQLVSCENDDKIVIYDCDKGTLACTVNTKKYGGDLIHFVPDQNCAIHSSTKVDDTIRYISFDRKEYLRYFPGHTQKVISLCISPAGNSFLSGSMDKTLRLWDLRSSNCQAVMHSSGRTIAAYDPDGVIFAAGVDSETIKLYDIRSFEKGPFFTIPKIPQERDCDWTGMKFSADGNTILISTNGQVTRLFNAFDGKLMKTFTGNSENTFLSVFVQKKTKRILLLFIHS